MGSQKPLPHLWEHSNGTWYLAWQEGKKPRKMSLRTKAKAVAEVHLNNAIRELLNSDALPGARDITLHEAAESWFADRARSLRGLQQVTLLEYRTFINQLCSVVPDEMLADEVTPSDIRLLVDNWKSKYQLSATTMKKRFGRLRMLFGWMVEEDLIRKSPVKKGDIPFAQSKQKPPWTVEGFNSLMHVLDEEIADERARATSRRNHQDLQDLVRVLWLSGMRSIQAYRLLWNEDVNLEGMAWRVKSPRANKGGEKIQPIHKDLRVLLECRKLLGGKSVFPPKEKMKTVWTRFKNRHPEFLGWSFHQPRSRVVTDLRGMEKSEAAKELVGHSEDKTSDLYNHPEVERHRAALDEL